MTRIPHLTPEQKKLAEENEPLIYSFLHHFGYYDINEFYGAAAIGLCIAAVKYNPERGSFSTIAYLCMRREIKDHAREYKRNVRPACSLDETFGTDEKRDRLLHEIIPADDEFEPLEDKIDIEIALSKLTEQEREILTLWNNGKVQREIAKEYGMNQVQVSRSIQKSFNKLRMASGL